MHGMLNNRRTITTFLASIFILSVFINWFNYPCFSAVSDDVRLKAGVASDNKDPVDQVVKDILLDEIKLAKFNLHYRLEATKQGRFKGWRYFAFQEANSILTSAGLIVTVSERMGHIHGNDYLHLHTGALEHSNVLSGVGQTLGASGSIFEFMINGYHSFLAWRKGYSPGQGKKYVLEIVARVDQNLSKMQSLANEESALSANIATVHKCEQKVLTDIRDLLVNEFDNFHTNAKRTLWTQQSFYVLDTAKNVTGAVGNLFGYKALRQHRRLFNQPAGVLTLISGSLIFMNPLLSRGIGKTAAIWDKYNLKVSGLAKTNTVLAKLQTDCNELTATCNKCKDTEAKVATSIDRLDLYGQHQDRFATQYELSSREIRKDNRVAVQNVLSGIFIGGTKIANGVLFTEAGYSYSHNPKMTNALLGVGAIPYLAGSSFGVFDNLRIQVMREVDTARLKKKHQLPGQMINDQLNQLQDLEKFVQAL